MLKPAISSGTPPLTLESTKLIERLKLKEQKNKFNQCKTETR